MRRIRRHVLEDDAGVSLAELLVAMAMTLVIGSLLATALVGGNKIFRTTRDESVGQTDVRTTIERLGRDVRNARSLDPGATASQLVLWVDTNSDYKKQASEIITWKLLAGTDGHFDVARTRDGVVTRTARFVISNLAFQYRSSVTGVALATPLTAAQASSVTTVDSDILYARDAARALAGRHTVFSERMRNVS